MTPVADIDLERVKEAWRAASSADVVRALREVDEYSPEVANVIRGEVERRGVTAASFEDVADPKYELLRPVNAWIRSVSWRVMHRLRPYHRPIAAHPYLSAAVFGALFASLVFVINLTWSSWPPDAVLVILLYGLHAAGMLLLCLPLRRPRLAILVPAIITVTVAVTGLALLAITSSVQGQPIFLPPPSGIVRGMLGYAAVWAGPPAIFLFISIRTHNKHWPYHEPGKCRVCEYDLRGLPEPRCPECGTPFEPGESATPANT